MCGSSAIRGVQQGSTHVNVLFVQAVWTAAPPSAAAVFLYSHTAGHIKTTSSSADFVHSSNSGCVCLQMYIGRAAHIAMMKTAIEQHTAMFQVCKRATHPTAAQWDLTHTTPTSVELVAAAAAAICGVRPPQPPLQLVVLRQQAIVLGL